jgi:peptide/nickel transport system substrate-binding protein
MQRSVRCLMSLVLIIAFMLMLVGCGEKPVSKKGKEELVIALDRYLPGKKPPDGIGVASCTQVYEPLLFLNNKLEIQPGLVTSWERIDDLNWRLKLRKGVKFHNSKEFDAESAKYIFIMNLDKTGYTAQRIKEVVNQDSFKIADKHTLEVKTIKPYPFFPALLTHPSVVGVEPEHFCFGQQSGSMDPNINNPPP